MLAPVVLPERVTVKATLPLEALAEAEDAMERVADVGAEDVTTAVDVMLENNTVAVISFI